jgi:two-component sensor histidine kinase
LNKTLHVLVEQRSRQQAAVVEIPFQREAQLDRRARRQIRIARARRIPCISSPSKDQTPSKLERKFQARRFPPEACACGRYIRQDVHRYKQAIGEAFELRRIDNLLSHRKGMKGSVKNRGVFLPSAAPGLVALTVEDDGTGLAETRPNSTGLGLKLMQYRLMQALVVAPRQPHGTRVSVSVRHRD